MARGTSSNYSTPSFPIADADDDPFVLEDIQDLAAALNGHDHSTGKGAAVAGGGGSASVLLSYTEASDLYNGTAFSGGAWGNIGSAHSFTVTDASAVIMVVIGGYGSMGNAGGDVGFRVLIDGSTGYVCGGQSTGTSNFHNVLSAAPVVITGLSAASHTVQYQVRPTTGCVLYLQPATNPAMSMTIRVLQL